MSATEAQPVE
jgi:ribosomal RNA assembly protein